MNKKTTHIFLGGGGEAEDSKLLDERFVSMLDHSKPLVYIPNAMKSTPYASCLEWFESVMKPLGVTKIEMWDDLRPHRGIEDIAGLYLGGGDTGKLLKEIRGAAFDGYLRDAVESGVPIYGGSAGAIVLGEDIRTAPEAKGLNLVEATGLNMIKGYSIACHYQRRHERVVRSFVRSLGMPIIAIPEKAGCYIKESHLTNHGSEQIVIFQSDGDICLNAGESTKL